jgi:hypothetical protein
MRTLEAAIGPFTVDPGIERTLCINFRLDNPERGYIRRIRADLGKTSHHMTIYRSHDTVENRVASDCLGFDTVMQGDRPLFIAQQHRSDMTFPRDENGVPVGYAIDAHQMVRVEMHFLNTLAESTHAEGKFFLDTVPAATTVTEADIAFWGTVDISIPPNSTWETPMKFVSAPPDMRTFALTTHQHRRGKRMRVWHADDVSDTAGEPVVDGTSWSDPPLVLHNPPLVFGTGGKAGLAYKCEWENTTPVQVSYGEGFNDEMCFLWQYYYPGHGFSHIVQQ